MSGRSPTARADSRIAFWLSPAQIPLARALQGSLPMHVVAAGGTQDSGAVAVALETDRAGDLRTVLASLDCDAVVILDPADFGSQCLASDATAASAAAARGVRVLSPHPIPGSLSDLARSPWPPGHAVKPFALPRHAPVWREAADALRAFAQPQAMDIRCAGPLTECSAAARIWAALDLVHACMGDCESIDAAVAAPARHGPLHAAPPERLRKLAGDAALLIRFAGGRCASVFVSDRSPRTSTDARLLGPEGELIVNDSSFLWTAPDGSPRDQWTAPPDPEAFAIARDSLTRALDPALPQPSPPPLATLLSWCEAALLSARTQQPEAPGTLLRLAGLSHD